MGKIKAATVDEYMEAAPPEARTHLRELREILRQVAPEAREAIKWGVPVFEEKRILFSLAAFKNYVTFMPTGPTMAIFADDLKDYKCGKDTIQFPHNKPLPEDLIRKIAEHRAKDVRENDAKWMY